MKVIICGANGAMGKNVLAAVESGKFETEAVALVDISYAENDGLHYKSIADYDGEADCVIDFSHHLGTAALLDYCTVRKLPVVIATTGHTPEEEEMIRDAAQKTAIFHASNMSIGVAVLCDLAKRAAAAFPDADIEIIERHHNRKADAPSGTALTLAKELQTVREDAVLTFGRHGAMKRQPGEIGIHAVRYGNEVGTHEIIISNGLETITLKHEAENRSLFADGAVRAAEFLCGKPAGFYDMKDILN